MSVFGQIDYVRYCDGKIASEESDKEIRSRLNQIYSMMKKKEENFLIYSFQTNDKIYGICNVYSQYGELLTFCTDDLEYSFSFSYDEKEDKCLFYYQDKAIDITKMFDKEKECYLVINNGEKDIYFVISYEDKMDDDCTISQYSDENATVTQGVKVKDIKDRFVRIK